MPFIEDLGGNIMKFIAGKNLKCKVYNETRFQIPGDDPFEITAVNGATGISNLMYKEMVKIYCISCGYNHFTNSGKVIE